MISFTTFLIPLTLVTTATAGAQDSDRKVVRIQQDGVLRVTGAEEERHVIGISTGTVGDALAAHLEVDPSACILVAGVLEGYGAEAAGLEVHDVITHVNGRAPADLDHLREALEATDVGDTVRLRVLRKAEPLELDVEVGESKAEAFSGLGTAFAAPGADGAYWYWYGNGDGEDGGASRPPLFQLRLLEPGEEWREHVAEAQEKAFESYAKALQSLKEHAGELEDVDWDELLGESRETIEELVEDLTERLEEDDAKKDTFRVLRDGIPQGTWSPQGTRRLPPIVFGEDDDRSSVLVFPREEEDLLGELGERLERLDERLRSLERRLESLSEDLAR